MSTLLELNNIECRHDDRVAVRDLSMCAPKGSLVCLLGPSGCGKTTVLRAIAGFHALSHGEIVINGRCVSRPRFTIAPEARRLGMVFQDYALFPHMTVKRNIGFGLRRVGRAEKSALIGEMLERVGLDGMGDRYPHELSGGQQQRVALARALAPNPDLLLMDEPFSNLDVDLRERLIDEVRQILKDQEMTCVLVTHDQHDAFSLGDEVGVMYEGGILQWDSPYNLYHRPATRFIADFIGQGVFLAGTLATDNKVETELGIVQGRCEFEWQQGTAIDVLLRPDDVLPDPASHLKAEIVQKAFKGAEILYTLQLASGGKILSLFPSHADHAIGEQVGIRVKADHVVAFKR